MSGLPSTGSLTSVQESPNTSSSTFSTSFRVNPHATSDHTTWYLVDRTQWSSSIVFLCHSASQSSPDPASAWRAKPPALTVLRTAFFPMWLVGSQLHGFETMLRLHFCALDVSCVYMCSRLRFFGGVKLQHGANRGVALAVGVGERKVLRPPVGALVSSVVREAV